MSNLPCPICHNTGKHKMDCQNGPYTYGLRNRINKLEAERKRLFDAHSVEMVRADKLQAKLDAIKEKADEK